MGGIKLIKTYMKINLKLIIFCIITLGLTACSLKASSNNSDQKILAKNTEITISENDMVYKHEGFYKVDTIDELLNSKYIVKGKVVDIAGPFETTDVINEEFLKYDDYFRFHTDIIIEVDQYIGEILPYDYIVVRREGGKIGNRVHLTQFENFTVGEEVIIFNLENDPLRYTQVLEGYEPGQYFSLLMNTTFRNSNNKEFIRADGVFKYNGKEKITMEKIEELSGKN